MCKYYPAQIVNHLQLVSASSEYCKQKQQDLSQKSQLQSAGFTQFLKVSAHTILISSLKKKVREHYSGRTIPIRTTDILIAPLVQP